MANLNPYGTESSYKEFFDDLLADVQADEPDCATNIMNGFFASINDWMIYHEKQANVYQDLRERVRTALGVS